MTFSLFSVENLLASSTSFSAAFYIRMSFAQNSFSSSPA